MIVASVALANDCTIVTENERDFAGLEILNPMRTWDAGSLRSSGATSGFDPRQFLDFATVIRATLAARSGPGFDPEKLLVC